VHGVLESGKILRMHRKDGLGALRLVKIENLCTSSLEFVEIQIKIRSLYLNLENFVMKILKVVSVSLNSHSSFLFVPLSANYSSVFSARNLLCVQFTWSFCVCAVYSTFFFCVWKLPCVQSTRNIQHDFRKCGHITHAPGWYGVQNKAARSSISEISPEH